MTAGRTIAISDIHGCLTALDRLLEMIAPRPEDCLVQLGDVIDRGPDSRGCIERLLELEQHCRVVHLMGNHEEMLLDVLGGGEWRRTWQSYGGAEMLASYGGGLDQIPLEHLDFIRAGKDYFETDTHIFVHGYLRPDVPVEAESNQVLRWTRFQPTSELHVSGKRVICGHTAQRRGLPVGGEHYVCIDTCAYCESGYLSALDVGTNMFWQASDFGEVRGPRPLQECLRS